MSKSSTAHNKAYAIMLPFKAKKNVIEKELHFGEQIPILENGKRVARRIPRPMYTNELATFVGQETGGGYFGNTSGYSRELVLPNSKIRVFIPTLQFIMNVEPKLPFGRGVIPDYEVIPTFEQYNKGENASLKYILEQLETAGNS